MPERPFDARNRTSAVSPEAVSTLLSGSATYRHAKHRTTTDISAVVNAQTTAGEVNVHRHSDRLLGTADYLVHPCLCIRVRLKFSSICMREDRVRGALTHAACRKNAKPIAVSWKAVSTQDSMRCLFFGVVALAMCRVCTGPVSTKPKTMPYFGVLTICDLWHSAQDGTNG